MTNDERAGVGTDSGRASVLWVTRRWRVANAFPRQYVGRCTVLLVQRLPH